MQKKSHTSPSRFAKWSLVAGIVIVLNMFFNYAISLVYKEPMYPTTTAPQVVNQFATKEDCLAVGGQWTETAPVPSADTSLTPKGYCDPEYTARTVYEQQYKHYQRTVFIVLMLLGVGTLLVGIFVSNEVLAASFSWGGVLSLLIASMRYWSEADNVLKVVLLAAALAALVWVAVRKFAKRFEG
ncbi:MAG TPA: hypothetical protein VG621_00180 [Candidatus Paceibacterota bacterium]|nr:hypothetical protein [Candidatus Paceibacterota bacterium]